MNRISELEKLLAIEDIKQLKARYFRFVDTQNWPALRALLADDAVLVHSMPATDSPADGGPAPETKTGADVIITFISTALENARSVHKGYMPEITIYSDSEAAGIWAMSDKVYWPDKVLKGNGHYHETYRKRNGKWIFQTISIRRMHREITDIPAP